jgi:diaminobutyrate-2-oxoglutarate transaminase
VAAHGCQIFDEAGCDYLDFFSGAGALNYGHNHPRLKRALLDYLAHDGIVHSLDMATRAKEQFLRRLEEVVLAPRGFEYRVQFPGPTGTNAVEAALKLARKVTGRETVVGFTNAFHGMTLGSLSVSGNAAKRRAAGVPLVNTSLLPYDGYLGEDTDSLDYLEAFLDDPGSGLGTPAAVILETLQAEGGLQVASIAWLQRLAAICRQRDILLIVDDIQVGCGRTGPFFSFERAGITPDLVCLSKSLSGYGLPLAVTLIRPDLDWWEPGEHNGTFRGHNPAFVTAAEALHFWETSELQSRVDVHGKTIRLFLESLAADSSAPPAEVRGLGCIQGLYLEPEGLAERVARVAFERGLILETAGVRNQVVKLMPPLIIDEADLKTGLEILAESLFAVWRHE